MSVWTVSNWAAWVISAVLLGMMLCDFLKTEIRERRRRKQSQDTGDNPPSNPK